MIAEKHQWLAEYEILLSNIENLGNLICINVPFNKWSDIANHHRRVKFHIEKIITTVQAWETRVATVD